MQLREGNPDDFALGYNLAYVHVLAGRFAQAADC
jgi:hypothetical protein